MGWGALAELAGPLESCSEFFIAFIVVLVLSSAWGGANWLFHSHKHKAAEDVSQLQTVDPGKAKWHSTLPQNNPPDQQ